MMRRQAALAARPAARPAVSPRPGAPGPAATTGWPAPAVAPTPSASSGTGDAGRTGSGPGERCSSSPSACASTASTCPTRRSDGGGIAHQDRRGGHRPGQGRRRHRSSASSTLPNGGEPGEGRPEDAGAGCASSRSACGSNGVPNFPDPCRGRRHPDRRHGTHRPEDARRSRRREKACQELQPRRPGLRRRAARTSRTAATREPQRWRVAGAGRVAVDRRGGRGRGAAGGGRGSGCRTGGSDAGTAVAPAPPTTTKVTRQTLVDTETEDGELGYGPRAPWPAGSPAR